VKIIKFVVENVKCLHAVSITPDGNLIIIGGNNSRQIVCPSQHRMMVDGEVA